jgi:2-amino-4-hydroxy-6-hydroxymethyldihydropteridine diphosphokinase
LRYFLGIGSNVNPEHNVPRILEALLDDAGCLVVSRVVRTAPVGPIEGGGDFLNLVVALDSPRPIAELRRGWQAIEVRLGRDRDHPNRKRLSRPADIDLLFHLEEDARAVDATVLPTEGFLRPALLDLLDHLRIAHGVPTLSGRLTEPQTAPQTEIKAAPPGVRLTVAGVVVGERPTTLEGLH